MNQVPIQSLSPGELLQLMHFYAQAGADVLIDNAPIDRFEEFAALERARQEAKAEAPKPRTLPERGAPKAQAAAAPAAQPATIPDAEAVAMAERAAAAANTVDELVEAVCAFSGCNLRNSARNTVFIRGNREAKIAIACGSPSADDDRDGQVFAGVAGAMMNRMLASIGLGENDVLFFNVIPWRPPGNRQPTVREVAICKPFADRLIAIHRPRVILALGNFASKYFTGSPKGIHATRGQWASYECAGGQVAVLPTFHPQDLINAPVCKPLAWQDLLSLQLWLTN